MKTKRVKETVPATDATPTLTKRDITRAAFNDSTLSQKHFKLGEHTFPVKDLSYDEYTKFLMLISPLADSLIGKITDKVQAQSLGLQNLDVKLFSIKDIITYCGDTLPELAAICIRTSEPEFTAEKAKELGKTPFALAEVVFVQLVHNNTLKDFADFFQRVLPLFGKKQ